jgi:hypothetical protein
MSLTIFIPSKDRPAQLRLLLQSIRDNLPVDEISSILIGYKYSTHEFREGYEKLRQEKILPNIDWCFEFCATKNFIDDILLFQSKYMLLMTDDTFVYRYIPSLKPAISLLDEHPTVLTFSLRLGHNTNVVDYTKPDREETDTSSLLELHKCIEKKDNSHNNVYTWNWKSTRFSHFSHPISLDGTIIRREDLKMLTRDAEHNNYRQWECCISDYVRRFDKNLHGCFEHSSVVTIPINQVVEADKLTDGVHFPQSTAELNKKYLHNEVVDYHALLRTTEYSVNTPLKEFQFTYRHARWYDWWLGK